MLPDQRDDRSEAAFAHARPQLLDGRMETTAEPDREYDAGFARGIERRLCAGPIERNRLFHEDMLAGRCCLFDLRLVQAVRGREHERIDRGIAQELRVTVGEPHAVVAAERFRRRARAGIAGDKTDVVALALHRGHQRAAPAAEPYDCCTNHEPRLLRPKAFSGEVDYRFAVENATTKEFRACSDPT